MKKEERKKEQIMDEKGWLSFCREAAL